MGIAAILQLVLGLEPLITRGIAAIQLIHTGGAPGSETYDVYLVNKQAIIAADKQEIISDQALDAAAIKQVGGQQ